MTRHMRLITLVPLLVMGIMIAQTTYGQVDFCPALVERALEEVGQNCAGLGRNSACYGFNRVDATFTDIQDATLFSAPADQVGIQVLESLTTAPLDITETEWGIAVMNVQANLPDMLPGQGVTMLLMGDVELENAAPSAPSESVEPRTITNVDWLNLRTRASERANVLVSIPPRSTLLTDATDETGDWLRVVYDNRLGWVNRQFISRDAELDGLTPVEEQPIGSMQAFYLRTGITGVSCEEAPPSMLLIQSPNHLTVSLNINGVGFSIGSTIGVQASTETGTMNIAVFEGHVQFEDGTRVNAGFTVEFPLNEQGLAEGGPRNLRRFTEAELASFQGLQNLPGGLLQYSFAVDEGQVDTIDAAISAQTTTPREETSTPSGITVTPATIVSTATPTPTSTMASGQATLLALGVSAPCVPNVNAARHYVISNPNSVSVGFNWSVDGTLSGNDSVSANDSTTITVPSQPGGNVITVAWSGGSGSADSNPCAAPAPTETPTPFPTETPTPTPAPLAPNVATFCNELATGKHRFVITNPNNFAVNANITLPSGNQSGTIDAGLSTTVEENIVSGVTTSISVEWSGLVANSSCTG